MTKQELLERIKGKLIISCQALETEPLYDPERTLMDRMALAAKEAGSPMIRTCGVRDILAIKEKTGLPVIGLIKIQYEGFDRYITPTAKEVEELRKAGAEVIAIDCTDQKRGDGSRIEDFMREMREKYPDQIFMADISTFEEGVRAEKLGFDLVSTTMSGYTPQSAQGAGPDYEIVRRLSETLSIPVIGEGKLHTPEEASFMLRQGAYAVVVGGAITRPLEIAARFQKAVTQKRASVEEILEKMILAAEGNQHDIEHFLKVHAYARTIGMLEGLDQETRFILETAAVIHDIAVPFCRARYGSADGRLQEKESEPLVRDFLKGTGLSEDETERIVYLVCHHHTIDPVAGIDHRILLEADFLVNAVEGHYQEEQVRHAKERVFRTKTGLTLLEALFQ